MNNVERIPFLDLHSLHEPLEEELVEVFRAALSSSGFIGGPEVKSFEEEFATFCDTAYCVGVSSGTDALRFALIAAGIEQGDSVLTVPNSFIATTEAITQAGGVPEFVDVDERTYNIDSNLLSAFLERECSIDKKTSRLISHRTGRRIFGLIPVHLYGQMADMDEVNAIAEKYHLAVIEDACQAHGARYFSKRENTRKRAGSVGTVGAFSFYPGKNLGACGEGGAITTNDADIAQKVRMLRDHGQKEKYFHEIEGYNGRLDAIQAGILRRKLQHLHSWNQRRRESAARYNELIQDLDGVVLPYEPSWSEAVYHLYVIRTQKRDELRNYLSSKNIDTGLHYPVPLHLQMSYEYLGYREGDFPVAERVAREIISLPMFPGLQSSMQKRLAEAIASYR
jgi:dTDP-4-amino-4,6-dideoxygalactose transaminase